jgi:ribosomal protein L16 Arg81 hydroxylase
METGKVSGSGAQAQAGWEQQVADALDRLIGPMTPDRFFGRYYDLEPLLCAREDPQRYSHLLDIDALDALVDGADLRHGMVELVRGGRRLPGASFTSADGRIIASAVAEQYLQGATIILPHLQESMPGLRDLCRALEMLFSCHVQANAYLTPAGESGFGAHQDSHDIFVLQIEGAKAWRLYDRCPPNAVRGEGAGAAPAEEVRDSFTLKPGDCLYLPRGLVHDASNKGEAASLHVTIGLLTKTWGDLLLAVAAGAVRADPAFARPLPPGFARFGFDRTEMLEELRALINSLSSEVQMREAVELLAADFLHGRRPNVAGVIAAGAAALLPDARYRRRPLVQFAIATGPGGLILTGPGGDLRFDGHDGEALATALGGTSFQLQDLSCPDPRRLFGMLWSNGYLEPEA